MRLNRWIKKSCRSPFICGFSFCKKARSILGQSFLDVNMLERRCFIGDVVFLPRSFSFNANLFTVGPLGQIQHRTRIIYLCARLAERLRTTNQFSLHVMSIDLENEMLVYLTQLKLGFIYVSNSHTLILPTVWFVTCILLHFHGFFTT